MDSDCANNIEKELTPEDCERIKYGDSVIEKRLQLSVPAIELSPNVMKHIPYSSPPFGYGLLSQTIFLRTYARIKPNGHPETWREVVERVMTGLWSIFVWHMRKSGLPLDECHWEEFLTEAAKSMYNLQWCPPGRGLWMMGTDFVYQRGATALNNCAAISTETSLVSSACWAMDTLMNGSGVGFDTLWKPKSERDLKATGAAPWAVAALIPKGRSWKGKSVHTIPDSREGWVWSVKILLNAYLREEPEVADEFTNFPEFDYSLIRKKGEPIKGFGGIASGPDPLRILHRRLNAFLKMQLPTSGIWGDEWPSGVPGSYFGEKEFLRLIAEIDYPNDSEAKYQQFLEAAHTYMEQRQYDTVRFIVDVFNAIGDCVVSGNVRRSSEIAIGEPESRTFRNLKDLVIVPERASIAHNSNNTVRFTKTEQYTEFLPRIAEQIRKNGEPGLLFQLNISRYGRISRPPKHCEVGSREYEEDSACLSNPCGEICLESKEFCNLSEIALNSFLVEREKGSDCFDACHGYDFDMEGFMRALEFATFYCKCVSLLPCHSEETNAVIARNRRIGVSLSGVAIIYDTLGATRLIDILKRGYRAVRRTDLDMSRLMGVTSSIRVTTCKPSGTISLLSGSTPGIHFALGGRYAKRRVLISNAVPLTEVLKSLGVENEPAAHLSDSTCFTFYIDSGHVRPQHEVGLYEMLTLVATVQREWADNMVSTTVSFDPVREGPQLEQAIANFAPVLKSCAFLPNNCDKYDQMPFERISREEYEKGIARLPCVDLSKKLAEHIEETKQQLVDPEVPKYCDGMACVRGQHLK